MKLKVRVIPNARKNAFMGYREDELLVRLTAPALEGKANRAATDFIAELLGISRSSVSLISGEKSRHKIFEIVGFEPYDLEGKLPK
jgi:uncharacterized protein